MKDSELQFDRTCHVLYSKPCKRQIREKIALHYPEGECETVWEQVQRQYVTFLRGCCTGRSSRRRRPATSGVSVGRGLNVVSASVLRRDDTTFKAPCKILQTCGTCYNNCPVCGTRLGYTPSCQPIPGHCRGRQSGHFLETGSLHLPLAALRRFPRRPAYCTP